MYVCMSLEVAPETHWPDLEVLILVVSDHKKPVSSTEGMRRTVETSELLKVRSTSPHSLIFLVEQCVQPLHVLD